MFAIEKCYLKYQSVNGNVSEVNMEKKSGATMTTSVSSETTVLLNAKAQMYTESGYLTYVKQWDPEITNIKSRLKWSIHLADHYLLI